MIAARAAPAPSTSLPAAVLSVGYQRRRADDLVGLLAGQSATVLADVRLNAVSRVPGFSKNRLREALAEAGID